MKADGITGDELLKFISQDETMRPDGTKGAGLFAYLRGLQSSSGKGYPSPSVSPCSTASPLLKYEPSFPPTTSNA